MIYIDIYVDIYIYIHPRGNINAVPVDVNLYTPRNISPNA